LARPNALAACLALAAGLVVLAVAGCREAAQPPAMSERRAAAPQSANAVRQAEAGSGGEPRGGERPGRGATQGRLTWLRRFLRDSWPIRLAVAPNGDVVLAGVVMSQQQLGGEPRDMLTWSVDCQMFVAKFDSGGEFQWSRCFGARGGYPTLLEPDDVAIDPAGNIILAGVFDDELTLGTTKLTCTGEPDLFLAKLDPRGRPLWAKRYGDAKRQYRAHVAAAADGQLYFTGCDFRGCYRCGAVFGGLPGNEGSCFLAKLTAQGQSVWRHDSGAGGPMIEHLAVRNGRIAMTGNFVRPIALGGLRLEPVGAHGTFLAVFDAAGQHVWSRSLGNARHRSSPRPTDLALDARGGTVLVGLFDRVADFGGEPLLRPPAAHQALRAGFVARFALDGAHSWSHQFGAFGLSLHGRHQPRVAVDARGRVVVVGSSVAPVDLGAGPGRQGAFALALDLAGDPLWGLRFDANADIGSVAADQAGQVWAAGVMVDPSPHALFLAQFR